MLVGSKILYEEISSIDFPQHGEVFYFYGQALITLMTFHFLERLTVIIVVL
jgi:hypothetical protein